VLPDTRAAAERCSVTHIGERTRSVAKDGRFALTVNSHRRLETQEVPP
jgi:hypothetical protein